MSIRRSLRGMLRLIRVDTLRRVQKVCILAGRLICRRCLTHLRQRSVRDHNLNQSAALSCLIGGLKGPLIDLSFIHSIIQAFKQSLKHSIST